MSLNKHQRHVTSEELKAHFYESTLSIENIAQEMNISIEEVERVLDMDAPNGFFGNKLQTFIHLVWDVRDLINDNIRQNGDQPEDYTYLKGEKEDYWFLQ
ncbi:MULTISPECIES: DUF2316 family protein [Staphylococcus]|uniref:DUF2316 family protein n=1 Tax=Staphylococcus TaxID=1279 RepID=UPI000D1E0708|nr:MULTISPECIES: DUF2316 family protein [Staphylococcus]MCQ9279893.1 DUF2316 family protein [Staphylococcus borealis]PTK68486.1 DUF2316 domain-containing protein [Staphylococcus borealis]RIO71447.1 DUF2316 family protein [Staphylococcus borealis]